MIKQMLEIPKDQLVQAETTHEAITETLSEHREDAMLAQVMATQDAETQLANADELSKEIQSSLREQKFDALRNAPAEEQLARATATQEALKQTIAEHTPTPKKKKWFGLF